MDSSSPRASAIRAESIAIGAIVLGVALALLVRHVLNQPELSTRLVRYEGQTCTEHFDLEDGMERRTDCPSLGNEAYADTLVPRRYPRGNPMSRVGAQ